MNFTRPQIYISKKEDIEKLKKEFIDNGYTSLSRYFNELIMLGYEYKHMDGRVSIKKEIKNIKKEVKDSNESLAFLKKCVYEIFLRIERMEKKNEK